jgi:uncharacterized protein (DUF58 family)
MQHEFVYRLPRRVSGWRPGSHPGSSLGAGQEFVSHANLFDRPDPRRLDLRASLRSIRGDWLVRVTRQRANVPVHLVVDVSRSMSFRSKLGVAAVFAESLSQSAFRVGDALGMVAFDSRERRDLFMPPMLSRGVGGVMAAMLRKAEGGAGGIEGLEDAAAHLAGRHGLLFLVSDFHWPLDRLGAVLDLLAPAYVVPMILWDRAETEPPARDAVALLRDAESSARRTMWIRPKIRSAWRDAVRERRDALYQVFASRGLRPFHVVGDFDGEAMSQYFLEATA